MKNKILVIEDDTAAVDLVRGVCESLGYEIDAAGDGESGLQMALQGGYALAICDINLPWLGGFEVCRKLRDQDELIPILFLSARAEEVDKVLGLNLGADDYLTKPFSANEFTARVRALLRRTEITRTGTAPDSEQGLVVGDLEINPPQRRVKMQGTEVKLTAIEFDILLYLAQSKGRVCSREELMEQVWGFSASNFTNSVTSTMSRLRRKLEVDPRKPSVIETLRGVGYRLLDGG